jgi:hypothetical protein
MGTPCQLQIKLFLREVFDILALAHASVLFEF